MNFLLGVERILLNDVAKTYNEIKNIDDKTMKGDKDLQNIIIKLIFLFI
jgi:hypothetical protein